MTKEEFREDCYDMDSLYEFCCNNNYYDLFDDFYTQDSLDEYLDDLFYDDFRSGNSWREIRDRMNDIPEGYDWYTTDGWGGWTGVSDTEFVELRDNIEDLLEGDGFFSDDIDEEVDDFDFEDETLEEVIEMENIEEFISIA